MTEVGYFFIILGLLFGLLAWSLFSSRKDLRKVILALADHGPCSGYELKCKSGYRYMPVYHYLDLAIELGLVTTSYKVNSARTAEVRGEIKTRVFRLTTAGWQAATRLRAGGGLYDVD